MTGAAGELDGGCDGGVNEGAGWELAPLGWRDAGVPAGLVAGVLVGVVGEDVALAWPGVAWAKAAASPAVAAAAVAVIARERDLMRLNTRWR